MRARTHARECALKILYQIEVTKCTPEAVSAAIDEYFQWNQEPEEVTAFTRLLVTGISTHVQQLDATIKKFAEHWELARMAIIDKNILRLGCFEILFVDDIPPKVSINEAIELGKKFGDIETAKFVNGILDRVFKENQASAG